MRPASPVIKSRRVQMAAAACTAKAAKQVEILDDEGVVRAIRLRCSCGEQTVIELAYPDAESTPAPRPAGTPGTRAGADPS